MSQAKLGRDCTPAGLDRSEEIQQQIQELSGRDLQLWSIAILMLLVLASGFIALVLPNVMWKPRIIHVEQNYLPQLFFGLISLVVLFNIYLLRQKHTLHVTRRTLIRELALSERFENLSLIDPLTQLLNRRGVDQLLPREISRANRTAQNLTLILIKVDGLAALNTRLGDEAGDELLVEFATLMKSTFRGSDLAFRYSGDEFLVVMPDTNEPLAEPPMRRLATAVENWNLTRGKSYEMTFVWVASTYVTGTDMAESLRAAERKIRQEKHKLIPVF